LAIFAGGLEFEINIKFYWRIKQDELGILWRQFKKAYESQIESRANSKIKNEAPLFKIDDYIQSRPLITQKFHKALQEELKFIHIEAPSQLFSLGNVKIPDDIRNK